MVIQLNLGLIYNSSNDSGSNGTADRVKPGETPRLRTLEDF